MCLQSCTFSPTTETHQRLVFKIRPIIDARHRCICPLIKFSMGARRHYAALPRTLRNNWKVCFGCLLHPPLASTLDIILIKLIQSCWGIYIKLTVFKQKKKVFLYFYFYVSTIDIDNCKQWHNSHTDITCKRKSIIVPPLASLQHIIGYVLAW